MHLRQFRPSLLRIGIATAVVGVCAATAAVAQAHFLPDALTLPGLRLDGAAVPAFTSEKDLRAWIDERGRALRDRRVVLLLPEEASHLVDTGPVDSATLGDFGVARRVSRASFLGGSVIGTAEYAPNSWLNLRLGYRSLNFNYQASNSNLGFNVHMKGPIFAATFRF